MKFNVCTQPSPNDSAPSNTVLTEAADENRENTVFWPILAYFFSIFNGKCYILNDVDLVIGLSQVTSNFKTTIHWLSGLIESMMGLW